MKKTVIALAALAFCSAAPAFAEDDGKATGLATGAATGAVVGGPVGAVVGGAVGLTTGAIVDDASKPKKETVIIKEQRQPDVIVREEPSTVIVDE
jgi:hypothetical protein